MDDMQNQINAILNDPDAMQKIMAMAQNLNLSTPAPEHNQKQSAPLPDVDISTLQKLSGLAGQGNIDQNQRTLLSALSPYLSPERLSKLEKAMRAAKMASMASVFLGSSGFLSNTGR